MAVLNARLFEACIYSTLESARKTMRFVKIVISVTSFRRQGDKGVETRFLAYSQTKLDSVL